MNDIVLDALRMAVLYIEHKLGLELEGRCALCSEPLSLEHAEDCPVHVLAIHDDNNLAHDLAAASAKVDKTR